MSSSRTVTGRLVLKRYMYTAKRRIDCAAILCGTQVQTGDLVALDPHTGKIMCNPCANDIERYAHIWEKMYK